VFQLGDIFDNRKQITHTAYKEVKRFFFDKLLDNDITLYSLTGNHDSVYKNTLKETSPSILLREYDNIQLINSPTHVDIEDSSVCVIPWICKDNYSECLDVLSNSTSSICFCHFEIAGFSMHKGIANKTGISQSLFEKFDLVLSGHFHYRNSYNNIRYIGTPYQLTWHDSDDQKGFEVLDVNTKKFRFIENDHGVFHTLNLDNIQDYDVYKNCFVKLHVENNIDMDAVISELNSRVYDLILIQETETSQEIQIGEMEDTLTILKDYVDNTPTKKLCKDKLKNIMCDLYNEAILL
jgi:DNA repair exonuclease SbcCD nuclease subunit